MNTRKMLRSLAAVLVCAAPSVGQGELAITEVVDGTMLNGHPSWVQLTNVGAFGIQDLSLYSLGTYPDGSTLLEGGSAIQLDAVPLAPGDSYVVCYEPVDNTDCNPSMTCFEIAYFAPPHRFSGRPLDGDDSVALFFGQATGDGSNAALVDQYGQFGEVGAGTAWDFRASYAVRCGNASSSVWQACDWIVQPVGTLDQGNPGINLQLLRNLTTPFAHDGCAPSTCQPTPYCQPSISAQGCTASISGSANAMPTGFAGDFVVTAAGMNPGVDALFFFSVDGAHNDTAFLPTGTLCLRPPLGRTFVLQSSPTGPCQGAASFVLNDAAQPWGALTAPGSEMWIQCFYRDASASSKIAVSDALYVAFE